MNTINESGFLYKNSIQVTTIQALAVKYVCIIMLCTYETHSGYYNTALNQNLFFIIFHDTLV
jgi:hypothetical protein